MSTAPEAFSSLGARFIALARKTENSGVVTFVLAGQLRRQQHAIEEARAVFNASHKPAAESFTALGFRFLALAQQADNSGVAVSILAGQLRRQRQALGEAVAVISAGQGKEATEAVTMPVKGLSRANAPGD